MYLRLVFFFIEIIKVPIIIEIKPTIPTIVKVFITMKYLGDNDLKIIPTAFYFLFENQNKIPINNNGREIIKKVGMVW